MSDRDRKRRTFDEAADRYDAARPEYPAALYADLAALAGLDQPRRLLEIGPASGKATRPLAEAGHWIVGVELGPRLAAEARRRLARFPRVEIVAGDFDAWEGPEESFDLVYAATAWHWLDPGTKYGRARRLLKEGGRLAFWEARHAFPPGFDPFFLEIQDAYEAIGERRIDARAGPEAAPDQREEIEASGLFSGVEVRRYAWEREYSGEEYVALMRTFSDHLLRTEEKRERLEEAVREGIARRPGGRAVRHWSAILHVATAGRPPAPGTTR